MSTFEYLSPSEALHRAGDNVRDFERITGLRALSADRFPRGWMSRTKAGYMRKPGDPWKAHGIAHGILDKFKVIDWVRVAPDAEGGMVEVFYKDGSADLISKYDLLCVERPT